MSAKKKNWTAADRKIGKAQTAVSRIKKSKSPKPAAVKQATRKLTKAKKAGGKRHAY